MLIIEQPEGADKQKGPQERILQADQNKNHLLKVYHKNVNISCSPLSIFQFHESKSIYRRFFEHLQNCGGCTGLRDQGECKYSLICAHVEYLSKEENDLCLLSKPFRK